MLKCLMFMYLTYVGNRRDSTVSISAICNPICRNTRSLLSKILRPKIWYRRALKDDQEEIEEGKDDSGGYNDPNRKFLASIHAYSHQENGNTGF
jgi:hypothetical protein